MKTFAKKIRNMHPNHVRDYPSLILKTLIATRLLTSPSVLKNIVTFGEKNCPKIIVSLTLKVVKVID